MNVSSLATSFAPLSSNVSSPTAFIDHCHSKLALDDITGMPELAGALDAIRRDLSPEEWQAYIADFVVPHPIRPLLYEEPFTRRAYEKPRGYAGDAPMLDLVLQSERIDTVPLAQWWPDATGGRRRS